MTSEKTLLVIEDEVAILRFLRPSLEKAGWRMWEATTGRTVVLVAHRPEGLDEVDRVIRLGDPQDGPGTPWAGPR